MMQKLWINFVGRMEYLILTYLVPKRVGPVMRLVCRTPILLYRLGLGGLLAKKIILLGTVGRRTGKQHVTALEYGYNPETGAYFLMSGWGGMSDWYRNARANSQVQLWKGREQIPGRAEPASDEEVARYMEGFYGFIPMR